MTGYERILQQIGLKDEWYIFGTGIVAYGIYLAIKSRYGLCPNAFIVTRKNSKERFIEAERVKFLEQLKEEGDKQILVLIATPEVYHQEIIKALAERQITNYIEIDAELEYKIMAPYFQEKLNINIVEDIISDVRIGSEVNDAVIYMAKSKYDKIMSKQYVLPKYIMPIQVGAALSEEKILGIRDDSGDNISLSNRDFSELTATYWVWKNTKHAYKGICHYRRIFDLSEMQMKAIQGEDIDAVLPLPFVCKNNMSDQYLRYVRQEDVNLFYEILKQDKKEEMPQIEEALNGKYIYNYNMLMAKQEVFNCYCEFLFPVLQKMEQIAGQKGIIRNDRYLGYFGEILTSLFFTINKDMLKIVHANKLWFV